jgi:hypothetical protein
MSYLSNEEITCSHCQFPNEAEVWSIINVREDPELRDLLLGGELNMAECSACKEIFYAEHFVIYHDPDFELMAFVYPFSYRDQKSEWEEKTRGDFQMLQQGLEAEVIRYQPVTLFGLDELIQMVEWDEEASVQSDIVEALARQNGLSVYHLKKSVARQKSLPMVLPYKEDAQPTVRESVLAGLTEIHAINDRLFLYEKAREVLDADATWELPVS